MSQGPIADYHKKREECMRHRVLQRGDFARPNVFGTKQDDAEAARVRAHRIAQYNDWMYRAKGRQATPDEIASFLGEANE